MTDKEKSKYKEDSEVKSEPLKTVFVSIITSFIVLATLYFFKLRYIEGFTSKYGFYLFFAILSYSLIMPSIKQIRVYKQFTCMSGMMIGMTIGMIAGFLSGFYVGATNGMFFGSLFGMAVGISFGAYNGKCCGIMGVMEGIMAGFMGGLMGAMTAIMMFNDNLKAAGIIVFAVSGAIMFGLNIMIYKESRFLERKHNSGEGFTLVLSLILTLVTIWLMVFGPRSVLFQ